MPRLLRSKITSGMLWAGTVVGVGLCAYFLGRIAEDRYEYTRIVNAVSPEEKLEEQGRFDEAIQIVLNQHEGPPNAETDTRVAWIYLERAKKDSANHERWAQQAAIYFDKATALAPKDPFTLENAMDGFNSVRDYSENGCAHYEKALGFGEAVLTLLQGTNVTIEGHVRSYPTQPIKEGIEPRLKRIRRKVEAWCKN